MSADNGARYGGRVVDKTPINSSFVPYDGPRQENKSDNKTDIYGLRPGPWRWTIYVRSDEG